MKRLAVVLGAFVVSACNCGEDRLIRVSPDPTCETDATLCAPAPLGTIAGRVCAADGHTWLSGATVTLKRAEGVQVTTKSDASGRFRLEGVPAGTQTVSIEKGSFSASRNVAVQPGTLTVIPDDHCELDRVPRVAVVHGSTYDRVEGVLAELGVKTSGIDVFDTDWAERLLGDDRALDPYDLLFLNCRSHEPTFMAQPQMRLRLQAFVRRGGRLHASDQAYNIIEATFPEKIDFVGEDTVLHAADQGSAVDRLPARIIDTNLAQALARSEIDIRYRLSTWSAMVTVASDVHVYLTADSPLLNGVTLDDAPQIVGFHHGDGHVVYSSFHQEPGIGVDQMNVLKLIMFEL